MQASTQDINNNGIITSVADKASNTITTYSVRSGLCVMKSINGHPCVRPCVKKLEGFCTESSEDFRRTKCASPYTERLQYLCKRTNIPDTIAREQHNLTSVCINQTRNCPHFRPLHLKSASLSRRCVERKHSASQPALKECVPHNKL